jgi:glycosyltransferase involved in cell wall biosynthesis
MPIIYKMGDIAVLPSIWDEPAGMTMVETIASGLPLITTNSGGIPEYISNECSIILDRNDRLIDDIANSIKMLIDNPSIREMMIQNGKKLSEIYNLKNYYKQFIKLITNI